MGVDFAGIDFQLEADGVLAAVLRRNPKAELGRDSAPVEARGAEPWLQKLPQSIKYRANPAG